VLDEDPRHEDGAVAPQTTCGPEIRPLTSMAVHTVHKRQRLSPSAVIVGNVTAASAGSSPPGRPPFADATPAQIRHALTPPDAAEFDRQWREIMNQATELLDLAPVHNLLESWRRVAWMTAVRGPHKYQQTMATAEQRLRTGGRGADSVPWRQLSTELGLTE